ncbi:MAG: hypothetical protein LBF88_13990, partial [Planctomycetaceae bacterium]|nr:hypothetical protein [Planctomycetaceae bacterium]
MDIIVDEDYGRSIESDEDSKSREKHFKVLGTDDEDIAYMRLRSFIYENYRTFGRLVVNSIRIEEHAGALLFNGTADYKPISKNKLLKGMPKYSFSTKGGTAHITRSLKTVGVYSARRPVLEENEEFIVYPNGSYRIVKKLVPEKDENGKPVYSEPQPPNFKRGIGYEEGAFQGCDKIIPAWSANVEVTVPYDVIDSQYLRMLRMMTGTVNKTPFDCFYPGECLFIGCEGSLEEKQIDENEEEEEPIDLNDPEYFSKMRSRSLEWNLRFEFQSSPNVEKMKIGNIKGIKKDGYDYAWVLNRKAAADDDAEP